MDASMFDKLSVIAKERLDIETLAVRNDDSLDFYDGLSVWSITGALIAAHAAGYAQGKSDWKSK